MDVHPPTVAVLGEAVVDFKSTGPLAFQGYPGGSPYNVAVAVARLAQPVVFLSQISRDLLGEPLRQYLVENGVDARYVLESDAPTTVAFVEERGGHAHFQFMNRGAADTLYDPQPRPVLPDSVRFMQFGSISLLNDPAASAILDIVTAHRPRVVTVFDPNCRPALTPNRETYRDFLRARCLPAAHLVKVSDQDLAWLEPGRAHADIAGEWLGMGPLAVIVTAGERGATLFRAHAAPWHVTPPAVTVVDTVGAGDTFTAATMVGLLEREIRSADALVSLSDARWHEVMRFAAAAAALNCARPGANPPMRGEV